MGEPRSLDEARRLKPDLGFSVYAIDPRGAVTLEILEGEQSFLFVGATEAEAWASAFPDEPVAAPIVSDPPPDTKPVPSVFD